MDEIGDLQKEVEKDLAKVIFNVVEVEMADKQLKADAGSMLAVPQKSLFGWSTVIADKSITVTFHGGDQEFDFTFPIFDKKFYEEKTMDSFGFPSSTRIMVVDDSPTSRKLSRLAANYTNVDECADAPSAFQKLATSSPKFNFVVEDYADLAASTAFPETNLGCGLFHSETEKPTLKNSMEEDTHSSNFFCALHAEQVRTGKLPKACQEALKAAGNTTDFGTCL